MDKIYKRSEKYFNQQKKLTIYLIGTTWLVISLLMLFMAGINSITFLVIALNGIIFALITYFSLKFLFSQVKNLEVHLTVDGIQIKNGHTMEIFPYKDIKKITVKSTKSGELKSIQINLLKRIILLSGFENMNELIAELKNKVSQDVIKQKTMILDWTNQMVIVGFLLIALITAYIGVYFVQQFTNLNVNKIIAVLFLLLGIKYIYSKPMSRAGIYSEKYDVALGVFFILIGLLDIFK